MLRAWTSPESSAELNDQRNIIPSIEYALEGGMIPQATLCITSSPIHTVEYYTRLADTLVEAGAKEICLKDMAGIGRPAMLGQLTKAIKTNHPDIIIEYHGHSGPGLSMASMLEVCENGADVIDTAMEPLSWGKIHPDIISVQIMLKDAGFQVADINMEAYMAARKMTQSFIDEWLGYFINPANKVMSSLLLSCGLPGGMMGSMMADLKGMMNVINNNRAKKGQKPFTEDGLLVHLFNEVAYVWPRVGYPPLVTPYSQYVKNIALMNLLSESMDEPRFTRMDDNMWGMILGASGKLPGEVDAEIVRLAKEQGREFTDKDPHLFYPDELDKYRKEMADNKWDTGKDEEELFELAMHPEQYHDYKSGAAKERFEKELAAAKLAAISKDMTPDDLLKVKRAKYQPVVAMQRGQMVWGIDVAAPSVEPEIGRHYEKDDTFCYILTAWGASEKMTANFTGRVIEVCVKQGQFVNKGDIIAYIDEDK